MSASRTFTRPASPSVLPASSVPLTSLASSTRSDPLERRSRQLALDLARRADLWQPHVVFAQPRHYHRLAAGDGWEAWLLTWLPGQGTGLHDHGGSEGAFAVVGGVLSETVLVPSRAQTGAPQRFERLTRRYERGTVRPFGARHLHDVEPDGGPAVSLHVYTPGLSSMSRYRLDDGLLVKTSHERAGVDW